MTFFTQKQYCLIPKSPKSVNKEILKKKKKTKLKCQKKNDEWIATYNPEPPKNKIKQICSYFCGKPL